ncbi:Deoxycytidine kinase [Nymphaea thermarum]|nr:Deoxycytidine kinase [Nymphaea thermarum]
MPALPRPHHPLPAAKPLRRYPRNPLFIPPSSHQPSRQPSCGCRAVYHNGVAARVWVVYKEGTRVAGAAWLHGRPDAPCAASSKEEALSGAGKETEFEEVEGAAEEEKAKEGVLGGRQQKRLYKERRQRSSSSSSSSSPSLCPPGPACAGLAGLQGSADLLTIPGVGPRNLRKLVDNGIEGVADLKQLYRDKFFGDSSQKMVEYLQSSVGIIHKNHAKSITSFIKDSVDEELKEANSESDKHSSQKKRITFCVEGNISVGKTTFLQRIANETLELRDLVEVVPEPISKWQDIGPDHFNILDAFYAEPERYAYTFQNYVFVTRVMQERESAGGIKPLRLMERSVFSDRMVFVRAVHEANWMNEMEISIYDSWFDPVVSCLPGLIPDGFIYLRASPDTCHKRMMLRKRAEEGGVSLDYLRDLHEKHESWLFPFKSGNHGVISVSQLPLHVDSSLHPDIRDRVFYLEGNHMHSSIQKVPALVLDCEPNIDFNKDIEAKERYAGQVAKFFEFVKKKKEMPSTKPDEGKSSCKQRIVLPHHGGFWTPDKSLFPSSSLEQFDFKRAMSFLSS